MTTPSPSSAMPANRTQISFCGYVVLFAVFAAISFSFGYQTLNRYDPRPASWDAEAYYNMVRSDYAHTLPPFRFRVLTPALAGVLYRALPAGVGGSWDPVFLALLIVNSAMMALACLVLLRLGELLTGSPTVGLTAAFLYITGWNVVNATLGGALVDAAEILILLSLTVSVLQSRWWCVPLLMAVGPFAKETILLFGFAFCCVMLLGPRLSEGKAPRWGFAWTMLGLVVGAVSLYTVRRVVGGPSYEEHAFSWDRLLATVPQMRFVFHHELALAMGPLAVLGAFRLNRLPGPLLAASLSVAVLVVGLAAYAGTASTADRYLCNTIGPILSISGAILIRDFWPKSEREPDVSGR
jgi:hypothetical protein